MAKLKLIVPAANAIFRSFNLKDVIAKVFNLETLENSCVIMESSM
jgi:hypothetical protein